MTVEKYLHRIGIESTPEPTLEALNAIQRAHLYAVPYENLDILIQKPLSLKVEDLYEKIVTNGRGGYCFELNELFAWLLRQLGYGITDYFARFLRDEPAIPMRRHHVLRAAIPGETDAYLCDVGVGTGSPTYPIRMEEGAIQRQGKAEYRLTRDAFLGWVLEELKRGEWAPVFSFTEEPQLPIDFIAASFYCERSPDSIFNKEPMVAMRTETGRITLDGNKFRRFEGDKVSEFIVGDPKQKQRMLDEWFGIRARLP
jgi:N-hydroxyarylamine O-acetyltransferase